MINPKFGQDEDLELNYEKEFKKEFVQWTRTIQDLIMEPWKKDKTMGQLIFVQVYEEIKANINSFQNKEM